MGSGCSRSNKVDEDFDQQLEEYRQQIADLTDNNADLALKLVLQSTELAAVKINHAVVTEELEETKKALAVTVMQARLRNMNIQVLEE